MKGRPVTICACGHLSASHGRRDVQLVGGGEVACCWALDCRCTGWAPVVVSP